MSPNNTKIFETENTRFPIGYLAGGKQVGYQGVAQGAELWETGPLRGQSSPRCAD